ncbi:holin [Streptomyces sp. NPDC056638]|uniref:holin n=1 Tax=Streptomyces sp. NPDC056638 TaxID=3345887 RepID=UPI00369D1973
MASVFTAMFRVATAERTVRTTAQTLVATLGPGTAGVLDAGWRQSLPLAGSAALAGGPHRDHRVRER